MNIHVIRPGETIEKIAKMYNLSINELTSINPHFRSWEHLAPGAKLRIPEIPEYIKDELDEIDPFIEDYYPKINIDEIILNKDKIEIEEEKPIIEEKTVTEEKVKKYVNKPNNYYYNPYYGFYNYYPFRRRK